MQDGFALPAPWSRAPGAAFRRFERLLRHWHGVHEFTDEAECILRVAFSSARQEVRLRDGTLVRSGDRTVELHLWNEHLPRIDETGATIAWGASMERRLIRSLRLLSAYLVSYPDIVAVHGEAAYGCQMGHRQTERLAMRYGFEIVNGRVTLTEYARRYCDDFLFWGLTRTFNPHSLKGKQFHRRRHDIWLSRAELQRRWGEPTPP